MPAKTLLETITTLWEIRKKANQELYLRFSLSANEKTVILLKEIGVDYIAGTNSDGQYKYVAVPHGVAHMEDVTDSTSHTEKFTSKKVAA